MFNISDKTKKLIFRLIIFMVFAYLVFIMISYYTSDRVGMVQLSYRTDETNIVTKVYATYKLKPGEGQLTLSQNNDLSVSGPENAVSHAIILSTEGNPVTEVELELEYDESYADEEILSLYKQSEKGFEECEFSIDTEKNIIKAKTSGEGIWYVIKNNVAKK